MLKAFDNEQTVIQCIKGSEMTKHKSQQLQITNLIYIDHKQKTNIVAISGTTVLTELNIVKNVL